MHPRDHARAKPDHPALVVADTGEILTYGALEDAANRLAHHFRAEGVLPGDRVGLMLRNSADYAISYWAAQRAGVLMVLLSTHLTAAEAAYILTDSGAKLLITSADVGESAATLAAERATLIPTVQGVLASGEAELSGALSLNVALAAQPATPITDEIAGFYIIYSSGTTGRPKGIMLPFTPGPIDELSPVEGSWPMYAAFDPLVSFCAGPFYHGAPISGMLITHRIGGTAVTLRKFDAMATLSALQDWRVAHAQFVPTMFVRMLALPEAVRAGFDLSALRYVSHAAAPCPVEVKRRMIDWFGPIIHEYYGASENLGGTYISSEEWLLRPGSVGRSARNPIHVCDEEGVVVPANAEGLIYFEVPADRAFSYLNDSDKTARARHPTQPHWYSVGDIGRMDAEGYLFLTDRRDFMIISGGVNIYPQAVEDALIVHPKVLDAAVIGVPDAEYGERVKAVVQPKYWTDAGDPLARENLAHELGAWCRERISPVNCPRVFEFVTDLPRLASGKLAKHELRRLYGKTSD